MSRPWTHTTKSARGTFGFGRALGSLLRTGDFLALSGPLGAGKTHLIKGVAAGLGVPDDEPVVSPTFVLMREYIGRLKLYHLDAYRLSGSEDLFALGLAEVASESAAVVALEWADRTPEAIPDSACRIDIEHAGPTRRRLRVQWTAFDRLSELEAHLRAAAHKRS